jgi:hypothetical protein
MADNSLSAFFKKLAALFFPSRPQPAAPAKPTLMQRKVLVINFRPTAVPKAWKSSASLIQDYCAVIRQASRNLLVYEVVESLDLTTYPVLENGRQYDDQTWQMALANDQKAFRDAQGNYLLADYQRILQDFKLIERVSNQNIDEVWMFGGPYFGFYESRMVGKGAFWCNGPGIEQNCRRFVIMGYNYERDVKEMVHDFGHRAESILARQFNSKAFLQQLYTPASPALPTPKNDFERFLLTQGTVHRRPGGAEYGQDETAWVTALNPDWLPFAVDPNLAF